MGVCVACDKNKTSGSLEFCRVCYNLYKEEIKGKKPWTRFLKNEEQRERRRKEREFNDASLDQIMDKSYERNDRY